MHTCFSGILLIHITCEMDFHVKGRCGVQMISYVPEVTAASFFFLRSAIFSSISVRAYQAWTNCLLWIRVCYLIKTETRHPRSQLPSEVHVHHNVRASYDHYSGHQAKPLIPQASLKAAQHSNLLTPSEKKTIKKKTRTGSSHASLFSASHKKCDSERRPRA